jgi:hypothetical protein
MVLALPMTAKEIDARLMYDWKYPELFEKADLVAKIGTMNCLIGSTFSGLTFLPLKIS